MSALTDLVSKCCNKKVTKEEYWSFLDPILETTACQVATKDNKEVKFYYSLMDDEVLAIRITENGESQYWLSK